MEAVLILYAICASAVLIWSTSHHSDDLSQKCTHPASKPTIDYIAIPSFLLSEWIACYPNLVVFSIFSDSQRKAGKEDCPGMLTISMNDLPGLLKLFPPGSTGPLSAAMTSSALTPRLRLSSCNSASRPSTSWTTVANVHRALLWRRGLEPDIGDKRVGDSRMAGRLRPSHAL